MTTVSDREEKIDVSQVAHLEETARTIRDNAIAEARKKLDVSRRDLNLKDLLNHHPIFSDYFNYGLASGVAEILVSTGQNVKAVYFHDSELNPGGDVDTNMSPDATVHMLVEADTSAELETFISSLDRALANNLRELPSPLFSSREFILDAQLISEEDVRLDRGYAALISSMFAPALKIWACEV